MKRILAATLALGLFALAAYYFLIAVPPTTPQIAAPTPPNVQAPGADARAIEFRSDGINEKLLRVNSGVTGVGNVRIATRNAGSARWIMVLAAGMGRHASFDGTWTLRDFPELAAAGFQEPPPPILQSMSILRSLTRGEMKYAAEAGDRIVVLFCPKDEWDQLKLHWPTP